MTSVVAVKVVREEMMIIVKWEELFWASLAPEVKVPFISHIM